MPTNATRSNRAGYYQGTTDNRSVATQATATTAESSGITFAQRSGGVPETNDVVVKDVFTTDRGWLGKMRV